MKELGMFGLLGICSIEDIWKKQIHSIVVIAFAIYGIGIQLYDGSMDYRDSLGGICVGAIMYLISVASEERIGKGDALILIATGIYLGFWNNVALLWAASLLAGMVGLLLHCVWSKSKQYQMPFVPFLLIAYAVMKIAQVVYRG